VGNEDPRPWANLGTERIKAFSDGVFSIVITLLVLELRVPTLQSPASGSELMWALVAIWPKILTYAASFIVVGIYWIAHHNFFHYTHRTNRSLLWLNHFYLMSVSLIAFSAGLIGSYPDNKVAVFFYGLNLVMVGICLSAMWAYVMKRHMVNEQALLIMRATRVIVAIPIALYFLAMLAAFVNTRVSLALFVLVPLIYVTPGALEWVLEKSARAAERRP
jgi:uncharacterized membrane protein